MFEWDCWADAVRQKDLKLRRLHHRRSCSSSVPRLLMSFSVQWTNAMLPQSASPTLVSNAMLTKK